MDQGLANIATFPGSSGENVGPLSDSTKAYLILLAQTSRSHVTTSKHIPCTKVHNHIHPHNITNVQMLIADSRSDDDQCHSYSLINLSVVFIEIFPGQY